MNYFELFEIPVSLSIDPPVIKKKFYELSRKYHPDFFGNATGSEQTEVLEKSSMINKAFKVFTHKEETIKYVLQLKGLLEEEEKYRLSPDFLMEVMELNEQLMDAKMEGDQEKIKQLLMNVDQLSTEIYEPVKKSIEHYQEGITSEKELLQVKEYYYRKKYLNRILSGFTK